MKDKVSIFWQWFLKREVELRYLNLNDSLIHEIDKHVADLGDFIWEVGPGVVKPNAFTLSPGGDPALLVISKEIISFAPVNQEWQYFYSKQVKQWNNYFDVVFKDKRYRIDVSKWQYVLYMYEDKMVDILIKPIPDIENLQEEIYGIAEMILDSIIGEEVRIERVLELEIVHEFDEEVEASVSNLINLQDHFKKIFLD